MTIGKTHLSFGAGVILGVLLCVNNASGISHRYIGVETIVNAKTAQMVSNVCLTGNRACGQVQDRTNSEFLCDQLNCWTEVK